MVKFNIEQTDDYDALVALFIENELEFSGDEPVPTDIIKCWKLTEEETGDDGAGAAKRAEPALIGGLVLAKREGEYIIDGIAVDARYRKRNLGRELLETATAEARRLSGRRIYLVAKAPGFFRGQGFETISADEAPNFFECLTCPQRGVSCHPEVMRLKL